MDDSYRHRDGLASLNEARSLREKLVAAHVDVQRRLPFVARIALTLYDRRAGRLKTYLHTGEGDDPLEHYEAPLAAAPSLQALLAEGRPRVINRMLTFEEASSEHARRLARHGFAASYTLPIFDDGVFRGFLFFNAVERDVFTEDALQILDVYGHMIALMVIKEVSTLETLSAALKTTGQITHQRDPETGSHLDRMSRYSRLIARALADRFDLDDDYIEHVFMYSPLHDIGKIAIPDEILLKPARLSEEEMRVMRTHADRGRAMLDEMLHNFGLQNLEHVEILRNIAAYHHESVDGAGYPDGRAGEQIPLEARIVAVADVFDALTSKRPYKEAWSNDDAFAALRSLAGEQLDPVCVEAFLEQREEIEEIQRQFRESVYG